MVFSGPARFADSITIVCGPSSCGKSTYLARLKQSKPELSDIPVVMAHEYEKSSSPSAPLLLHYNTLRVIWLAGQRDEAAKHSASIWQETDWDFGMDPVWRDILNMKQSKQAVLIVTSIKDIMKRIELREVVEPEFGGLQTYPSSLWIDQYRQINLAEHYRGWLEELENNEIPVQGVNGTTSEFDHIPDLRAAISAIG